MKEDLLQVLSLINRISGIKTTLPFLGKILLETKENFLFLKATNLEISLTAKLSGKIESEGSLLCSARLLGEYVNLLEQEKIELTLEKNNLIIKTASSQAKVNIEESKDFPSFPSLSQKPFFAIPKSAFLDLAKKTTFATSQDLSKPVLSGVMLQSKNGRLVAVGTDGFRLSEMVLPSISEISASEFEKVIVPAKTILEITHLLENHKDSAEHKREPSLSILPESLAVKDISKLVALRNKKFSLVSRSILPKKGRVVLIPEIRLINDKTCNKSSFKQVTFITNR